MAAPTKSYLDFEKPVAELEAKVQELRLLVENGDAVSIGDELARLESKSEKALADLYASLTPWQKTQVARHPQRPHFIDYVKGLFTDFTPLSGDRQFGEDAAIICGFGWFRGIPSASSARRKAPTQPRASSIISAWRGRKAIARPCA